jgi:hypothetical protein
MWLSVLRVLDSVLFGSGFELSKANRIVRKQIKSFKPESLDDDRRLGHSRDVLDQALLQSVQRLERIESKAMGTLLGVATAVAVLTASYGLLSPTGALAGKPLSFKVAVVGTLAAAMSFLVLSGVLALSAYRIGEVNRPLLEDRAPLVKPRREALVILCCIEQNQRLATIRSNRLSAAFDCLRNGLLLMLLGGFLALIASIN